MRLFAFSGRTAKEILRDPLNLFFGLGFPLVLIGLLTAIQANIPVPMFELDHLTPGITVFGLSFMTLFAAVLVSKDRESALLQRLYTTPLTAGRVYFWLHSACFADCDSTGSYLLHSGSLAWLEIKNHRFICSAVYNSCSIVLHCFGSYLWKCF